MAGKKAIPLWLNEGLANYEANLASISKCSREKFRKFCDLILKDKSFKDAVSGVYSRDFKDLEDFNIKLVGYIIK